MWGKPYTSRPSRGGSVLGNPSNEWSSSVWSHFETALVGEEQSLGCDGQRRRRGLGSEPLRDFERVRFDRRAVRKIGRVNELVITTSVPWGNITREVRTFLQRHGSRWDYSSIQAATQLSDSMVPSTTSTREPQYHPSYDVFFKRPDSSVSFLSKT